jgi:hypothetical protein
MASGRAGRRISASTEARPGPGRGSGGSYNGFVVRRERFVRPRAWAVLAALAAVVVFCAVQERVVRAGVHEYVERQRAAAQGLASPADVGQVMAPWIRRSVRQALAGAAPLLAVAVLLARGRRDA